MSWLTFRLTAETDPHFQLRPQGFDATRYLNRRTAWWSGRARFPGHFMADLNRLLEPSSAPGLSAPASTDLLRLAISPLAIDTARTASRRAWLTFRHALGTGTFGTDFMSRYVR